LRQRHLARRSRRWRRFQRTGPHRRRLAHRPAPACGPLVREL